MRLLFLFLVSCFTHVPVIDSASVPVPGALDYSGMSVDDLLFLADLAEQSKMYDHLLDVSREILLKSDVLTAVRVEKFSYASDQVLSKLKNALHVYAQAEDLAREKFDPRLLEVTRAKRLSTYRELFVLCNKLRLMITDALLAKCDSSEALLILKWVRADYLRYMSEYLHIKSQNPADRLDDFQRPEESEYGVTWMDFCGNVWTDSFGGSWKYAVSDDTYGLSFACVSGQASKMYADALADSKRSLPATDQLVLGIALNYGVHLSNIMQDYSKAYSVLTDAYDNAIDAIKFASDDDLVDFPNDVMESIKENVDRICLLGGGFR